MPRRHALGLMVAFAATWTARCGPAQDLDARIAAVHQREFLTAAGPADAATWLRRVSFDLCGVPPTWDEVVAFRADLAARGDAARPTVVDRLLASPRYGERWAAWWLDLARYADSQGYEKDDLRPTMWRYRDAVIDALNGDLPFDEFTIAQLAGDLLPAPTTEQRVLTAFHRQTMTNTEGGTDDEEFRVAAVIDRVNTTMSVWMGATAGCAQCHDHKYDPIKQREYYELFAFFDQSADRDRPDDAPTFEAPTAAMQARAQELEPELAALQARLGAWVARSEWRFLGPVRGADFHGAHTTAFAPERDGVRLDAEQEGQRWQVRPDFVDGAVHEWAGDNSAFYLHRTLRAAAATAAVLALGSDDAIKVWWNGALVLDKEVGRPAAPDQELVDVALRAGDNELLLKITNGGGPGGFWFDLRPAVPELRAVGERIAAVRAELAASRGVAVPVMQDLPAAERRTTHVLLRGSFLTPGEAVEPGTPACWPPLPADAPRDRLGFARWLVAPDNPRSARVLANRVWAELFGAGLVATLEDFGSQGEPCAMPDVLDWLGAEFVRGGWSLKHLLRAIVLSRAYGRDSAATAAQREVDPYNRFCARGPAFRLPAEMLRDQALTVSGLLVERIGGPSVMPPQPAGVWAQIYSGSRWVDATGPDRYRRALYTFWRRTSPHPAMLVMDAQSRESCVLRRSRTNTPLQALVFENDPQFHEAASALAARARGVAADGDGDPCGVTWLWQRCLLREPADRERDRLLALLHDERESGADEGMAWSVVASVVMNLDEFLTKR